MFTIAETYIISIDKKASDHKTNIMLLTVELVIDTINIHNYTPQLCCGWVCRRNV